MAKKFKLDWQTAKVLEKRYLAKELKRARLSRPKAICIDEISIHKGHVYCVVVIDLICRQVILFIGNNRSQARMAMLCKRLGRGNSPASGWP